LPTALANITTAPTKKPIVPTAKPDNSVKIADIQAQITTLTIDRANLQTEYDNKTTDYSSKIINYTNSISYTQSAISMAKINGQMNSGYWEQLQEQLSSFTSSLYTAKKDLADAQAKYPPLIAEKQAKIDMLKIQLASLY